MKRCADCGKTKSLDDFTRNKARPDGRCVYCRACYGTRNRNYYRLKRERLGKPVPVRPEVPSGHKYCPRCKEIRPYSEWHRTRRTRDGYSSNCKFCRVDASRRTHLKRSYGLTPEEVAAMIDVQDGLCA